MSKLIKQFTSWIKTLSTYFHLSLTSSDFYSELYIKHKGYGFKYLINLSILSSLLICTNLVIKTNHQKQIFTQGGASQDSSIGINAEDLNYLINQFPMLKYDGESMFYNEEMPSEDKPFYIKLPNGENIAVIDLEGATLSENQKNPVPVVFAKKLVNISLLNLKGEASAKIPLEYKSIFGSDARVIDQSTIREILLLYFDYAPKLIIYIFFPIFSLFLFGLAIFQNLVTIALLLIVAFVLYRKISFSGCVRVVIYGAASITIIQALFFITIPALLSQKWLLELWVNFLLIVGLFKALKKNSSS